jgi:DNA polymerase-3 subunit epsilon
LVNVETTGRDPQRDEIIELAITPYSSDLNGTVFGADAGNKTHEGLAR